MLTKWKIWLLAIGMMLITAGATGWMNPAVPPGIVLSARAAETGSIQVNYTCDNGKTPIPGAEFSCVRIADGTVHGESISYTLRNPYDKAGYNPNDPEFGSDADMPEKFLNIYEKQEEGTASVKMTSEKGTCRFSSCLPGIYLVWQSGTDGEAENYKVSKPLIVSVPSCEKENLVYAAAVYPKTVRKPATEEKPEKPSVILDLLKPKDPEKSSNPEQEKDSGGEKLTGWQPIPEAQPEAEWTENISENDPATERKGGNTGDNSNPILWLGIAGASLAGTGVFLWRRKRRYKESD